MAKPQERPSASAIREFSRLASRFMQQVQVESEIRHGDLSFGTEERPFLTAPIDKPLGEIERSLREFEGLMRNLVAAAEAAAVATKQSIAELGIESAEANERITTLLRFEEDGRKALDRAGPTWHPAKIREFHEFILQNFGRGRPEIEIRVEVLYLL